MTRYSVFCTDIELSEWLNALSGEKHLVGIVIGGRDGEVSEFDGQLGADAYLAFFYPPANMRPSVRSLNDIRAREWGWVDVRPGGVRLVDGESILLLTTITAEDVGGGSPQPSTYLRWLKKRAAKDVESGVVGRNIETKAEAVYRDMYYTNGALDELRKGATWKQTERDRIVFFPENFRLMN